MSVYGFDNDKNKVAVAEATEFNQLKTYVDRKKEDFADAREELSSYSDSIANVTNLNDLKYLLVDVLTAIEGGFGA